MAKEIEREGIPVAVLSAIPIIPLSVGSSRVVRGVRVEHVCGDPRLSEELDHRLRMQIITAALKAVQREVTSPTLFEPEEPSPAEEEVHAA